MKKIPKQMRNLSCLLAVLLQLCLCAAEEFQVTSPDGRIEVNIRKDQQITYAVSFRDEPVLLPSVISMQLDRGNLTGEGLKIISAERRTVNELLYPVVPRKTREVGNLFNELLLRFSNECGLRFRVYDDGMAYRWETAFPDSITVVDETATFVFASDHELWFPEEESMFSHQERTYLKLPLSDVTASRFCSTAALVDLEERGKAFISESDLLDYPGMFLQGMKDRPFGLQGKFAGYPLETETKNDRSVPVTKHADFIARTVGERTFPWRVMIITETDSELITSDLVWKLATPNVLADVSWIKPGKVAWDWWNDLGIYRVDFTAGINTKTYKHYIDFASDYHLDYIILDEGWYHLEDVLKVKKTLDLPEIIRYGEQKGVGVILWVTWKALHDKMDEALEQFESWGVKGIKVDFMQRDDQWMVNFYTEVAARAAQHRLIVDFHGAYKPAGLHRTYPNVLTFEGVAGMEHSKWGDRANPGHDLTLPFIRMVAGPMDYTPGAMINAGRESFRSIWSTPMSQGTRCHQLAMYVVFESPLQMLSDNPTNYRKEPEAMSFLSRVPVTWDDTRVPEGRVAEHLTVVRRKNSLWFAASMTNWVARELVLSLDFLDAGKYTMESWEDGPNAEKQASDFIYSKTTVTRDSSVSIKLAPGGGWAAIFSPEE